MTRRPLAFIILICTLGLLGGCSKKAPVGSEAQAQGAPKPEVLVTTVTQADVPIIKEWVGALDGSVNVAIQSRVTGYITSVNYQEGAFVKQGALLFQVDPRPFTVAVEEAKAALAKTRANQLKTQQDADRYVALYAKAAASQQERDTAVQLNAAAKADVVAQEAALKQAELNLSYTTIAAPVTGIVGASIVNLGDLVNAGATNLTTISSVDPIKVYFSISEQEYLEAVPRLKELASMSEAQRPSLIELILANGDVYPYRGRFDFADREVDQRTGTIRITGLFPNPGNILRPGQFARVRIPTRIQKGALLVPQRAVNELQGSYQVVVIGPDQKAQVRPVQTGPHYGSMWVITEGLKPGERVVVEGLQKAREGTQVVARQWTPPREAQGAPAGQGQATGAGQSAR